MEKILLIKSKSIIKNFQLLGYQSNKVKIYGNWIFFTKKIQPTTTLISNDSRPADIPCELWDRSIADNWDNFQKKYPNQDVIDLDTFFPSPVGGFLSTSQFVSLMFQSDKVDVHIFSSILKHFGPLSLVNQKIACIGISVLSRGWSFNSNDKKYVTLHDSNKFIFNDSKKTAILLNNDSINRNDGYWLKKENNEPIELEDFWMTEFPNEFQSQEFIAEALIHYFPPEN